jgi:hypothetical protein
MNLPKIDSFILRSLDPFGSSSIRGSFPRPFVKYYNKRAARNSGENFVHLASETSFTFISLDALTVNYRHGVCEVRLNAPQSTNQNVKLEIFLETREDHKKQTIQN